MTVTDTTLATSLSTAELEAILAGRKDVENATLINPILDRLKPNVKRSKTSDWIGASDVIHFTDADGCEFSVKLQITAKNDRAKRLAR